MAKIAVIVGSCREGSYNRALAALAVARLKEHGAAVTEIDIAALDLSIYSDALERNAFPGRALQLKQQLQAQDGMLIVSPEYNGSIPALLINSLDWASRPTGDESPIALTAFRGKAAAIMSASVSPFGGLRGLMHLRQILTTIQLLVIPEQVAVPFAHNAFGQDGDLNDPLPAGLVDMAMARLVKISAAIAA